MNLHPLVYIAFASVLFSTGGLFIKLTGLSAFELAAARSLVAGIAVAFITRHDGFRLNPVTIAASVLYAALLLLFVCATKLTTSANAIFLQFTAPVYVLLLEPLMFRERYKPRDFLVVAACLGGMSLFFTGELSAADWRGNTTALLSGVCFALFMLLLRHPQTRAVNRAASVIYGNFLLAAVAGASLVIVPELTASENAIGIRDVLIVLYLGIVQIALAYSFFTLGIARGARSLDAAIVGYIEPLLNPLWVFLIISERPSPPALIGGAIIISAVIAHAAWGARRTQRA
jgi:drug/metabolite transporter (DMT)-like permease